MSEQVLLPNGEEADVVLANSINLRSIGSDANIDAKGGESAQMYFDKFSRIQPVYIVGALAGILPSSPAATVVTRTTQSDTVTAIGAGAGDVGTAVLVPDGATSVIAGFVTTAFTVAPAASTVGWQGSPDGVNWTADRYDFINYTLGSATDGFSTWPNQPALATLSSAANPGRRALPKYVRAVFAEGVGNTFTGKLWITVQ